MVDCLKSKPSLARAVEPISNLNCDEFSLHASENGLNVCQIQKVDVFVQRTLLPCAYE